MRIFLRRTLAVFLVLFAAENAYAADEKPIVRPPLESVNDGPHLRYAVRDDAHLHGLWVCGGKRVYERLSAKPGAMVPAKCGFPQPVSLHQNGLVVDEIIRHKAARWAAFSDVHGQFDLMVQLLTRNGIIDANMNWAFGTGHLIMTGDVFDRGPGVTESLWLLYRLDEQARMAGGAFHVLLGNHETMALYDDMRYVNGKYQHVVEVLGRRYRDLFDEESVLGRWLRSKNMIVQVNDSLFMHGGLHPDALTQAGDLGRINALFRQSIGIGRAGQKTIPVLDLLYGRSGPIWYRGYFVEPRMPDAELSTLFAGLGIQSMVVGHTTMEGIHSWYDGRIFSIDAGLKNGVYGEMLLWEDGKFSLGTLGGERRVIPVATPQTPRNL